MDEAENRLPAPAQLDLSPIEGMVDDLTQFSASGWAWMPTAPDWAVQIEAVLNGKVIARDVANRLRPDVAALGKGTGRYGFTLFFSEPLEGDSTPLVQAVGAGNSVVVLAGGNRSPIVGFVDSVSRSVAVGWAWMPAEPHRALKVEAILDGRVIGRAIADEPRADVASSGRGTGRYGFSLWFDEPILGDTVPALRVLGPRSPTALRTPDVFAPTQAEKRIGRAPPAVAPIARTEPDVGGVVGTGSSARDWTSEISVAAASERAPQASVDDTRGRHIALLAASGIFDPELYAAESTDPASLGADPIAHYYDRGSAQGRRPNRYFDPQWYVDRYPDVAAAGMPPLLHYISSGEAEGRQPSLLFNVSWYRAKFAVPEGQLALAHYLQHCRAGSVSPVPEFDIEYYKKHHPDVIAAGVDPFRHYVDYGYREGRAPSEEFDGRWYAKRYLNGDSSGNPFLHWLQHRNDPGVYGRIPSHETSIVREVKRFTQAAESFEELRPLPASAPRLAKVLAFYLPQYHAFPENDKWWGKGFTEWTNLARGLPRFKGHYQPRVPRDLGFYGLNGHDGNETLRRQVKMAQGAGLFGFVFYYYWFNGKRLLQAPLERFLQDPALDFPFALMWANENWTRRWDGAESEVLISQDYRPEDDAPMFADFARHFADPRYIRLGGRPLLMIYRPGIIPAAKQTVARWRTLCREEYQEDPIILMAQSFGDQDPNRFGLDGAVEFPPHKFCERLRPINDQVDILDSEFVGQVHGYDAVAKLSTSESAPNFPLVKTVVPGWDNDARRQGAGLVMAGSTPAKYQAWLAELVVRARRNPVFNESIVLVNAWNEWCEGAYLEPDLHFGGAYLNATARAITGLSLETLPFRLLLIGHDAFPSGSQQLLLNIGTVLARRHGVSIEFLLLDGGELEGSYASLAPTRVLTAGAGLDRTLADFAARGFTRALLNTSVTGSAAPALVANGIVPEVMLVHELPRILREKQLLGNLANGFRCARNVVFPAAIVQSALTELVGASPAATPHILPQGCYKALVPSADGVARLLEKLGLAAKESLVLGVGYADMRKGFDLFMQVWRLMNRNRRVHFCWAGALAPELQTWLAEEITAAKATGTFHLPGSVDDMASAYQACKALLLTSREDPFPTVTLEALSLGKPVIAFAQSGGMPEMLLATKSGFVVPYADTVAMAEALEQLLEHGEPEQSSEDRRTLIRDHYSFPRYVQRLMSMALPEMPKISVAVPNYNYARYVPERLASVFQQTHPVHEVIVLDDHSSDSSLEVIPRSAAEWNREIQLITNPANGGSVIGQWARAAQLASGEWLWIAEADDSSHPDFLAQVMAAAGNDPSVVMAFSDSRCVGSDGSPLWESYKGYYATLEKDALTNTEIFDGGTFVRRFLAVKNLILNASAVVWRREVLLRVLDSVGPKWQDLKVAGDWLLYLEALSLPGARIAYQCEPLNVHRRHERSVTHCLASERHVGEIERCHDFARQKFPLLPARCAGEQQSYRIEVGRQLSGSDPMALRGQARGRP